MRPAIPLFVLLAATSHCQKQISEEQRFETASLQLQRGEYEDALGSLQELADDPDTSATLRFRADRDAIECIAHVHGEEQARTSFQALWKQHRDSLDVQTLAAIGGRLAAAHCPWAAYDVIKVANEIVVDPGARTRLERLARNISLEANSSDMDSALGALGYL